MGILTQRELGYDHLTNICFANICSLGGSGSLLGTPVSALWPTANKAILVPFSIGKPIVIQKAWAMNGTAVSGNIDIGIYSVDGTLIVSINSSGTSNAQSGTSVMQVFALTATLLDAGVYYLACSMDNTSGTLYRINPGNIPLWKGMGLAQISSGAYPLPASATLATLTINFIPLIGISTRSVV